MPLFPSYFFYKEIGIYSTAVCFIPSTEDFKWVMNFHFHDTCSEYSKSPLLLFTLPGYVAILTELSSFSLFSPGWYVVKGMGICHLILCSLQ